jgi:hypothetical protein
MHSSVFSLRTLVAVAALALSATVSAAGQDAQAGQTVFKDPATGQIRNPTATEAKQFNDLRAAQRKADVAARKASGAPAAGVPRLQSNGILVADLDESSMTYSVVRRNAHGGLDHECVDGAHAAAKTLSTPVTTQSKEHQNEVQ